MDPVSAFAGLMIVIILLASSPGAAMDFDAQGLWSGIGDDIKGALIGGTIATLMDTGTWWHRARNGFGSMLVSFMCAPFTLDMLGKFMTRNTSLTILVSALYALGGLIFAEAAQRVFRRIAGRSEQFADKVMDRIEDKLP